MIHTREEVTNMILSAKVSKGIQWSQVADAIQQAMEVPGPVIIDFVVKEIDNVYPMIPSGQSVSQMMEEPSTKREV